MGYSQIRHFLDSNEYTQVPNEWFLKWRIWDLRNKFWNKPNCTKSKSRTGMSRPKSVLVPTHIQSISGILVGKIGPTSVWTSLITNLITRAYFFGVFLWWAPFEGGKKCFTLACFQSRLWLVNDFETLSLVRIKLKTRLVEQILPLVEPFVRPNHRRH